MVDRPERFQIQLGEYYADLLKLDAWVNGRTKSLQAGNLLGAKIQERESKILERIAYLAEKRGISPEELRKQVLNGVAIEPED
jgi:ribosome assembly protein YihI (activator of Der GTPase)